MLILAGLGISDEKGITLEELEEAKASDFIFVELYTNIWHGDLKNLEKIVGKKIEIIKRKDLEEEVEKILQLAINKKVMIFVPGDPLVATTHSSLIIECKKRGIGFKVFHNSSIFSAVYETGLHAYKFGPTITIPLKEKIKGKVESIIEVIKENKKRGLHTLCLLDIDLENNRFLEVKDAIKFLIESKAIEEGEKVVVASCIGTSNQKIIWKEAKNLIDIEISLPAVIVIPGKLHFSEREALEKF
jgi:diphthine synthase